MTRRMLAKKLAPLFLKGHKELAGQLAAYLIEERRTDEAQLLMNDIAVEVERLGHSEVELRSAHQTTASLKSELESIIKNITGAQTVNLNETIDQSLIGGIIATTPSTEIDLSVRSQLKTLTAS